MHHKDNPAVTIFLCGGMPGVAETAARKINAKAGREIVVGTYAPAFDLDRNPAEIERTIAAVNASGATVLLVGLGGGRQEKFIVRYRDRFPHVRLFLPLGGTIDYEAGTLKRPPPWVTDSGLEWFYRLVKQPRQRWQRYMVEDPPVLRHILAQKLDAIATPSRAMPGPRAEPRPQQERNGHARMTAETSSSRPIAYLTGSIPRCRTPSSSARWRRSGRWGPRC